MSPDRHTCAVSYVATAITFIFHANCSLLEEELSKNLSDCPGLAQSCKIVVCLFETAEYLRVPDAYLSSLVEAVVAVSELPPSFSDTCVGLGEASLSLFCKTTPELCPHVTGDLKVNVLLYAFTHANCSACKADSNNFEQLFDKLLLRTVRLFFFSLPFFCSFFLSHG